MATYTVTNTFTADTTAVASEVNQNFTDVLTALNAFDAGNLSSGTVPVARISGLTVTQIAAATLVTEAEGIANNDNDTTWPTCAAVKDHVDNRLASEGIQAWVAFDGTGANGAKTPTASYNITSVVKDGTGKYTITWATNFASANYVVVGMAGGGAQAVFVMAGKDNTSALTAGDAQIDVFEHNGTIRDAPYIMAMAIGTQ